jgi:hypothetical protein
MEKTSKKVETVFAKLKKLYSGEALLAAEKKHLKALDKAIKTPSKLPGNMDRHFKVLEADKAYNKVLRQTVATQVGGTAAAVGGSVVVTKAGIDMIKNKSKKK